MYCLLFFLSIQELQQTFFKEMMSSFQDMVDRQTDKLSDDAGKVKLATYAPFTPTVKHA